MVSGPPQLGTAPGAAAQITFTVENLGTEDDTYDLAIRSLEDWGDSASFPATIAVPAGQSTEVVVTVNVPTEANLDDFDELTLIATSQSNPNFLDVATTTIVLAAADLPPTVEIISPTDGAQVVEGTTTTVTIDAEDDVGVTRVDLLVNGEVVTSDTTAPFTGQFVAPAAGQPLVLTAVAEDTNGQTTTSAPVNLTVIEAVSDVLVGVAGGRLRITGSALPDQIIIEQLSRGQFLITPQGETLLGGSDQPQQFSGVSRGLHVDLKEGDDLLTIDGVKDRRRTLLHLGGGDDQLYLTNSVLGGLAVDLGEGNDVFELVQAGHGPRHHAALVDVVFRGWTSYLHHGKHASESWYSRPKSYQWLLVFGAEGDDQVTLQGLRSRHSTALDLGDGDDEVHLVDSVFGGLAVDFGDGDDELSMENSRAHAFGRCNWPGRNVWTFLGGGGCDSFDVGVLSDPNGNGNHLPQRTEWNQFKRALS